MTRKRAKAGVSPGGRRGFWRPPRERRVIPNVILRDLRDDAPLEPSLRSLAEAFPEQRLPLSNAAERAAAGASPAQILEPLGRLLPQGLHALLAEGDPDPSVPAAVDAIRRSSEFARRLSLSIVTRLAYAFAVTCATAMTLAWHSVLVPRAYAPLGPSAQATATTLRWFGIVAFGLLVLSGIVSWFISRNKNEKTWAVRLLNLVPPVAKVHNRVRGAAFVDQLAALIESGTSLDAALVRAARRSGYPVLEGRVRALAREVERGHDAVDLLAREPAIPGEIAWMLAARDGALAPGLRAAAATLRDGARSAADGMAHFLYPAIIVALAVVVGVALALQYGVIFSISGKVVGL